MRLALFLLLVAIGAAASAQEAAAQVLDIGSRRELFVDHYLIEAMDGVALRMHEPAPAERVLWFDNPWEGRFCGYVTVLLHERLYRMYYRGLPVAGEDGSDAETTCYASSVDGIHWTKPDLGIYEVCGTRDNNVILANAAPFSHNFSPFVDTRPGVPDAERFKALAGTRETGLVGFVSADGVHWKKLREEPLVTGGAFDSQNLAFWSEGEKCYVCYYRIFSDGFRSVSRCTSPDFITWTEGVEMSFGATPREHLYTNHTLPYFRAPHIYVSIAARFMPGRRVVTTAQMEAMGGDAGYSGDCSDTVLFTSRGGNRYDRTFMESLVRPGIGFENWTSRTNYPVYGIVPGSESSMAFYVSRNYGQDTAHLQRFTMRLEGFSSISAPYVGGELVTKAIRFTGRELVINYSTSAAGSVWVEIEDAAGQPIDGYRREQVDEIIGDEIDRVVSWEGNSDVSALAGVPVRLRFLMRDADLYSVTFR
jgi:hypothetical protein